MATFIAKPCRTAAGTLLDCVGSHPSCSQYGILRQCCWWVQILKVIPYSAMQLYSYEVFKRLFSGPKGSLSVQGRLGRWRLCRHDSHTGTLGLPQGWLSQLSAPSAC